MSKRNIKLESKVLDLFDEPLGGRGFIRHSKELWVRKINTEIAHHVQIHPARFGSRGLFDLEVYVGVKSISLQKTIAEIENIDYSDSSTVFGGPLPGLIPAGFQSTWPVNDEVSLRDTVKVVMDAIDEFALPYFSQFSSIEDLLIQAEAGRPYPAWVNAPYVVPTALYLLGHNQRAEAHLKSVCQKLEAPSSGFPEAYREAYSAFANQLLSRLRRKAH